MLKRAWCGSGEDAQYHSGRTRDLDLGRTSSESLIKGYPDRRVGVHASPITRPNQAERYFVCSFGNWALH
jgi:hypothetical protein